MRKLNEICNELMDVVCAMLADPKLVMTRGADFFVAETEGDRVYLKLESGEWSDSYIGGWYKADSGPHSCGDYCRGGVGLHIGRNVDGMLSVSIYDPEDGDLKVCFSVVGF